MFCYWISDLGDKQCRKFFFNYTFLQAMGCSSASSKLSLRHRFWFSVSFDSSCLIFVPDFDESFTIRLEFFVLSFHICVCVCHAHTRTRTFPLIIIWREIRRFCFWGCQINTISLDVSKLLFNKYLFEELCSLNSCKD